MEITQLENLAEYHVENNRWDEFRVEFSISAVKTKSLWTKVAPKSWSHHCLTYEHAIGSVTMFSQGQKRKILSSLKRNLGLIQLNA